MREPDYPRGGQAGPRQRYNNYLHQQRHTTPYYSPRALEGGPRAGGQALGDLEEVGAYRALPDLGYPARQPPGHYFEQLDSYLHSGR